MGLHSLVIRKEGFLQQEESLHAVNQDSTATTRLTPVPALDIHVKVFGAIGEGPLSDAVVAIPNCVLTGAESITTPVRVDDRLCVFVNGTLVHVVLLGPKCGFTMSTPGRRFSFMPACLGRRAPLL
jgi:hypothetical protein